MVEPRLGTTSICIKLKVGQFTFNRLNYISVFTEILAAAFNLPSGTIGMAGRAQLLGTQKIVAVQLFLMECGSYS